MPLQHSQAFAATKMSDFWKCIHIPKSRRSRNLEMRWSSQFFPRHAVPPSTPSTFAVRSSVASARARKVLTPQMAAPRSTWERPVAPPPPPPRPQRCSKHARKASLPEQLRGAALAAHGPLHPGVFVGEAGPPRAGPPPHGRSQQPWSKAQPLGLPIPLGEGLQAGSPLGGASCRGVPQRPR